jgi:gamma-glutamyl:cysteine ligase YbdK (ATP-grasp superfamily)
VTNLFSPRTFSTDWEVMVVDRLERCVGMDKIKAFAGVLWRELDLPVGIDWNALEFGLGVNHSLAEIWDRIQRVTDRATELLAQFNLSPFPAASHPMEPMFNSSHVHVGTLADEVAGFRLENRMIRYNPCFAALAANSPFISHGRREYKSHRVSQQAHGCTRPSSIHNPQTTQASWGSDAGPKLYGVPTYEVRITDCASSRRFLAELATFVAAFVHHQGTLPDEEPMTPDAYRECLTNRWLAARHGLQATFLWHGKPRPVTEILSEMLDEASDTLQALGARRSDLALVETMLAKRTTQADYWRTLGDRYTDPYLLASAWMKLARHWDTFDTYLTERAPTLDPVPAPDDEAILEMHLKQIGEGTHFYRSRETMLYPAPVADAIIEQLVERGSVTREMSARRGNVLSRRSTVE